ncbi:LA2681 family HEPN domain-containing protein, partial [Vibrio crassostreae]|uniref:LA2681 family HEPN domain-containing protein n=1 Tax=Vibrio crassostreae TaxID=246167 RepID=UPI00352BE772
YRPNWLNFNSDNYPARGGCYARYLMYQATSIENDETHYFNKTFQHVDSRCGAIDNLKVSHLKSAFKILYSLFDKIAYFIHRFFDLNDISKDNKIYIDKLFQKLNGKGWKPNEKLEDGKNYFINALFFILQDLRDVKGFESVSKWIDPNAEKFSEIRNAMEHRSLVVVDTESYHLITNFDIVNKLSTERFNSDYSELESGLGEITLKISKARKAKDKVLEQKYRGRQGELERELAGLDAQRYEKQKLSSHTLHITVEELEARLFTLIKLVRNSIMYLSLSINLDSEMKKEHQEGIALPREIPLKGE